MPASEARVRVDATAWGCSCSSRSSSRRSPCIERVSTKRCGADSSGSKKSCAISEPRVRPRHPPNRTRRRPAPSHARSCQPPKLPHLRRSRRPGSLLRLPRHRPGHLRRSEDGTSWEADPLIIDERFLAVDVRGKGIVVFTACSHAGVVNVLRHARDAFSPVPLYAVAGGFHLSAANERIIPETVADLSSFELTVIAPGHCTGWRATNALVGAFGESVVTPSAVGKTYVI